MNQPQKSANPIDVLKLEGRYPYHPRPLSWRNISTKVSRVSQDVWHVRIDDDANPEAWFIVTIQLKAADDEGT